MDFQGIVFSEISQTKKTNPVWYHLYVEFKIIVNQVAVIKKKQTYIYIEQSNHNQWEAGWGRGNIG